MKRAATAPTHSAPGKLSPEREARFIDSVRFISEFFMGGGRVLEAMADLVRRLEDEHIPYAIVGALALGAYGYRRATEDVDVLLTAEGLERFKRRYLGRGYLERFPGSRGLRDTANNVPIDVVLTGHYPGDGREKPVAFPDPAQVAARGENAALLPLATLIELKLASGISAPHRLRDLADVLELIRTAQLGPELAEDLSPYVRDKYQELWRAAQGVEPE